MIIFDDSTLASSYQVCLSTMKERAVSFYQGFQALPEKDFYSVSAVYAFCRYADDITDHSENPKATLAKLEELESMVEKAFSDTLNTDCPLLSELPWLPAFLDTLKSYPFEKGPFLNQINGQKKDASFHDIETMEELKIYCDEVAGSVGLMLLPILALPEEIDDTLKKACLDLGRGMQITNILRDIGEDIRTQNRVYIPKELMKKYGIKREDFETLANQSDIPKVSENIISLIEELRSSSKRCYSSILNSIQCFKKEARVPLVSSAFLYHAIEESIQKEGYNCFTKRCYTSPLTRGKLVLKAKDFVKNILQKKKQKLPRKKK